MTERGDRTRARLIEATLAVVAQVGYARASTRAIAQHAGVAEGTIYRHFPDKTALFFAAALESSAPALAWVEELPARAGQDTVESNLTAALTQLATLQERVLPLELAIQSDPELSAQRRTAMAAAGPLPVGPPAAIAAYLAAERRAGRVRADVDPVEVSLILLWILFGLGVTLSASGETLDPARLAADVRIVVQGIAPAGDGPR
ncbi:MAG: helix-turn-helix domain-containing protein [Chloroflexota bacterium]